LDDRTGRARLHRKIGNTFTLERRYDDALQEFDAAEGVLGSRQTVTDGTPQVEAATWYQEWIQIQLDAMYVHYWASQPDRINTLIERARPVVERYGTPSQRAGFFKALTGMNLRRYRYLVPDETLEYLHAYMAAQQDVDDPSALAESQFIGGHCYLWRGDLDRAEALMLAALALAERIGDLTIQSRCLTYLALTYRRLGRVEAVRLYTVRGKAVSEKAGRPEYVGMALANEAWAAWRTSDPAAAEASASAALEMWRGVPASLVGFRWTALWPLLHIALRRDDVAQAIEYARAMLHPSQVALADELTSLLERAIRAWDADGTDVARDNLKQATALAEQLHYL
jgi:hypothetical protein